MPRPSTSRRSLLASVQRLGVLATSLCALLAPVAAGAQDTSPVAGDTLTFEMAKTEASQNTEAAELLELEVRASEATRKTVRGELMPVLSASVTGILNQEEVSSGNATFVNQFDYSASVDLTMDLFRGPTIAEYMATGDRVEAAQHRRRWESSELRLVAGGAYLDALAAERNVAAARDGLALSEATLEQVLALQSAGYALPADVSRARLGVEEARVAILEAERQRDDALDALAFATGRESVDIEQLEDPGLADGRTSSARVERTVEIEQREDVLALDAEIEANDDLLLGRWLAFLPTISLRGQYEFGRPSFRAPDGTFWSASVTATWVIFDYGRYGRLDAARVDLERSELVRKETVRALDRDHRSALRTVAQAEDEVAALEQSVETSQKTRQLVFDTYRAGDATLLELTEADSAVLRAKIRLNLARLELDRAWLQLDWLEGELTEETGE